MKRVKRQKRSKGTRYSQGVKNKVLDAVCGGMTVKEASRVFGPSTFIIKEWKDKWGVTKKRGAAAPAPAIEVNYTGPVVEQPIIAKHTDGHWQIEAYAGEAAKRMELEARLKDAMLQLSYTRESLTFATNLVSLLSKR